MSRKLDTKKKEMTHMGQRRLGLADTQLYDQVGHEDPFTLQDLTVLSTVKGDVESD